ncbi:hypothetical protein IID10_16910 [candidate division KSB1 bacterium]|nr:hypothetical protein [candidate division KSB1 bacterium]
MILLTNHPQQLSGSNDLKVETGKQLKTPDDLEKKVAKNNYNQHLKEWWFVVTKKDLKTKYEKLGTTFTRTEIKEKIESLFV